MYRRDYKDIIGGSLLLVTGLMIAWHATRTLEFGTISRMGPGMFPASIGLLLAGFGIAILVPAFFRSGAVEAIEWRSVLTVLASVAVFAATLRWLGFIPATMAQIFISTLAEPKFRPHATLVMCVVLPLAAYFVFSVGLGLPITLARWPF